MSTSTPSASPAISWVTATCWSGVKRQMRRRRWGRPRKNVESEASSRIEMKHERGGRNPFPALGEERLEILVADRVPRQPEVGELQEQLLGDVARDGELAHGREQDVRLARGCDDEGAAVVARTAALASAAGGEEQAREHDAGGQPRGRSGGRHGA